MAQQPGPQPLGTSQADDAESKALDEFLDVMDTGLPVILAEGAPQTPSWLAAAASLVTGAKAGKGGKAAPVRHAARLCLGMGHYYDRPHPLPGSASEMPMLRLQVWPAPLDEGNARSSTSNSANTPQAAPRKGMPLAGVAVVGVLAVTPAEEYDVQVAGLDEEEARRAVAVQGDEQCFCLIMPEGRDAKWLERGVHLAAGLARK